MLMPVLTRKVGHITASRASVRRRSVRLPGRCRGSAPTRQCCRGSGRQSASRRDPVEALRCAAPLPGAILPPVSPIRLFSLLKPPLCNTSSTACSPLRGPVVSAACVSMLTTAKYFFLSLSPTSKPWVPGAAKPRRSPRTPTAPAAAAPSAASPAAARAAAARPAAASTPPATLREGAQRASGGARATARRRSATASPLAAAALPASPSPNTRARTPAGRGARAPRTAPARTPSRTLGVADPVAEAGACAVPAPRSAAPAPSPAHAPGVADAERKVGAAAEDEAALAALGALPLAEREAGVAAARRFINRRVSDPVRGMHGRPCANAVQQVSYGDRMRPCSGEVC